REAARFEFLRIDLDLVFADQSADAGDFRHARHRLQGRPDVPVLNRAQAAKIESFALHRVPEDLSRGAGVRGQPWHCPLGQVLGRPLQRVAHSSPACLPAAPGSEQNAATDDCPAAANGKLYDALNHRRSIRDGWRPRPWRGHETRMREIMASCVQSKLDLPKDTPAVPD